MKDNGVSQRQIKYFKVCYQIHELNSFLSKFS
jgi:hypothetical protein